VSLCIKKEKSGSQIGHISGSRNNALSMQWSRYAGNCTKIFTSAFLKDLLLNKFLQSVLRMYAIHFKRASLIPKGAPASISDISRFRCKYNVLWRRMFYASQRTWWVSKQTISSFCDHCIAARAQKSTITTERATRYLTSKPGRCDNINATTRWSTSAKFQELFDP